MAAKRSKSKKQTRSPKAARRPTKGKPRPAKTPASTSKSGRAKKSARPAARAAHGTRAKTAKSAARRPHALKAPKHRPIAKKKAARAKAAPAIELGPTELDTIKLAYLFRDTSPSDIFRALMDTREHSAFTGGKAEIDARVGGVFHSYNGFIHGTTIELIPDARIVQSWRTQHFPKNNPNSTLELTFTPVAEGTRLEMRHLDVPKNQVEYLVTGWVKHYLDPLARHLGKRVSVPPPPL